MFKLCACVCAVVASVLLTGCAGLPRERVSESNTPILLYREGIPSTPAPLMSELRRYSDIRGHAFVDWHPTRREMLVAHRRQGAATAQLYALKSPQGDLEPLTDAADPVMRGSYEPREGRYLVYAQARGGDEAYQLFRLDLDGSRRVTPLTEPTERHGIAGWLVGRGELLVGSVPLDRTAPGGTRPTVQTRLWAVDPLNPTMRKRELAVLPGTGWAVSDVSADDRQLALTRYVSATESEVWVMDVASGQRRRVAPAEGQAGGVFLAGAFTPDGQALHVASDAASEFRQGWLWPLTGAPARRITGHIEWDVSGGTQTRDGRLIAVQTNEDGRDALRLFDGVTLAERPRPSLPAGHVGEARFHPRSRLLAFSVSNAQGPSQIHTLDPDSGAVVAWTRPSAAPGIDPGTFPDQQLIRWASFDGRPISGWLSRPPARFTGRRPVLIDIHGGPASQARAGFLGRANYFVQELGVVLIQPNVRGSSGYGKTFLALDDGRHREESVKDIGALLDWIARQPDLDASRVVVSGGSYGGYMSLASAVHFGDRIAGAIDIVGISNFVTFLERTESYRRDLRRVEYGDERDPAMREFLHRISPLSQAGRITKPLLVAHGRNDPRVPVAEAEQIVQRVRAGGTPVWYLRAENEGHGFARRENADALLAAMVMFLKLTMGL